MKKKTITEFIENSKKVHGDKYDYSLVEYKNNKTKVKIICQIHGIFEQTPSQHILLKQSCRYCMIDSYKSKHFIEKSKKIHGDKYDYSLVEYKNNKTKVKIICQIHGIFEQRPDNHIHSKGCYLCGRIENRKKHINRIEHDKLNKNQLLPNYNKNACILFDNISLKQNIHIQHAMNGGEYYIKELGYWVDGYDIVNNIVYEYYEIFHKYTIEKDKKRENEIKKYLNCDFIIIHEDHLKANNIM